jgi:hypothetical protein
VNGHDPLCQHISWTTFCACDELENARAQERERIIAAIDGTIAEMVAERRISTYAAARLEAAMGVTYELDEETLKRLEE